MIHFKKQKLEIGPDTIKALINLKTMWIVSIILSKGFRDLCCIYLNEFRFRKSRHLVRLFEDDENPFSSIRNFKFIINNEFITGSL